jgi:hypothetical protein
MPTKIYGQSDDLVEFKGEYNGEVSFYGSSDEEQGLIICDDGTVASVKYGKADMAIWQITVLKKGKLFDKLETCEDEDAKIYSDILYLKSGIKNIYFASNWEKV